MCGRTSRIAVLSGKMAMRPRPLAAARPRFKNLGCPKHVRKRVLAPAGVERILLTTQTALAIMPLASLGFT